jgi:hypothetical protein
MNSTTDPEPTIANEPRGSCDDRNNDRVWSGAPYVFVPVTDGIPSEPGMIANFTWEQIRDLIYEGRGA